MVYTFFSIAFIQKTQNILVAPTLVAFFRDDYQSS
jgi:hypothetical protein